MGIDRDGLHVDISMGRSEAEDRFVQDPKSLPRTVEEVLAQRQVKVSSYPDMTTICVRSEDTEKVLALDGRELALVWKVLVQLRRSHAFGPVGGYGGAIVPRGGDLDLDVLDTDDDYTH